jgi:short subunit dehydrogenase-like uncharacterized protein
MNNNIWVLGATGRSGRAIAQLLAASDHTVVLAGRDPVRLAEIAAGLGNAQVVTGSFDALLGELRQAAPSVVVNTIGPFARTSTLVIEACPPGTHYVDIGNELPGVSAVLAGHDRAVADGRTAVTGGGFGVLATESVVVRLCEGRSAPARLRVDAIPSLATEKGVVGSALAGSMLDGAADGGRRVENGRLVKFPVAGARQQLTTPAGDTVFTAALPTGDLLAAWRASNAESVISATSALPSGPAIRLGFPVVSMLMRSSALRRFAIDRFSRMSIPERARPREFSWGHARAEWSDGTSRESWLRLGDAQKFTDAAAAEIARRLQAQQAPAGSYTPAALFGASLATDIGGEFVGE